MHNNYHRRFDKTIDNINSDTLKRYARLNGAESFTRRRKMPLDDIVLSALSRKGLTTEMELRHYCEQKDCNPMSISKQGYLQQRKKLNPEVFAYLNREYLSDFYTSSEPVLWHGFYVFAIDGSKAEIPNSEENHKMFGKSGNHHAEGPARALVSGMFDVFNDFFLDIQIGNLSDSEIDLAKQNIMAFKDFMPDHPVLIIFDRGYPSVAFIDFLEGQNINYLFRLSSNDYIQERSQMACNDEQVELKHTYSRLNKMKGTQLDITDKLKQKGSTKTRISISALPSGNELALMTDLPSAYNAQEIADLYFKRWEIEKKYNTLKNKLKFESVTGKAAIYVYQDFWAQLFVYNMIQDVRHAADTGLQKKVFAKNYKNPIHVNENMAIGLFKDGFIKIMLEKDVKQREEKLIRLQESIESYVLPIRETKSNARKHTISNKYKNNQKNSF